MSAPLIRLRRLGGALARRTDVLIELLRRVGAPLGRIRRPLRLPFRRPLPPTNITPRGRPHGHVRLPFKRFAPAARRRFRAPTPREAPRGHVRLRTRAYIPPKPIRRQVRPPQRRLGHAMSPLERAALSKRLRRAYPRPLIEREPREIPRPHARLHPMHPQLLTRRRQIVRTHAVRIKAAAAPARVQVPAPLYYPKHPGYH